MITAIILLIGACAIAASSLEVELNVDSLLLDHAGIAASVNADSVSTWVAGVNAKFDGATIGFAKSLCGSLEDPNPPPVKDIRSVKVPSDFDARSNWPQCASVIGDIRDQASCGSCWAFGSTESFNDRTCIQTNGTFTTLLSPEDVLSCCILTCGMGCNGGFPSGAWSYFEHHGLVTGGHYGDTSTCYPYQIEPCEHHVNGSRPPCKEGGGTPHCEKSCANGATWDGDKHFASSHYSVSADVDKIQTEIFTNGPITGTFTVYEDFLAYKSGVYQHSSGSALGGHAIKVMGWGSDNGTPYWLVANSWNTDWGDNGVFKILSGSDECGIESGLVTGLPKV